MGGCSAINCQNHSKKKIRMFKFPKDPDRKTLWTIRCRRKDWVPGPNAQLCIEHFEENQFELNRQDGWKKLKQTAVPTLFNIPGSSSIHTDTRIKENKHLKPDSLLESYLNVSKKEDNQQSENERIRKIALLKMENDSLRDAIRNKELSLKIALLEKENESLRNAIREKDKVLSSFLTEGQIELLNVGRQSIAYWNHESITKALEMRINLGKKGYNYLRQTGYPLPSWSTINRRIRKMKLDVLLDMCENDIDEDDIDKNYTDKNDIEENSIYEDDMEDDIYEDDS